MKYVNDPENLRLAMMQLKNPNRNLQLAVFHVLKIFVPNPYKADSIVRILTNNKQRFLAFLQEFEKDTSQQRSTLQRSTANWPHSSAALTCVPCVRVLCRAVWCVRGRLADLPQARDGGRVHRARRQQRQPQLHHISAPAAWQQRTERARLLTPYSWLLLSASASNIAHLNRHVVRPMYKHAPCTGHTPQVQNSHFSRSSSVSLHFFQPHSSWHYVSHVNTVLSHHLAVIISPNRHWCHLSTQKSSGLRYRRHNKFTECGRDS